MPGRKRRVSKSAVRRLPKPLLPASFLMSEADWEKLEKAYDHKIPKRARRKIMLAMLRMLQGSKAEYHARPVSESIKHITRLGKLAKELLAAWTASDLPSGSIRFAEEAINQGLYDLTNDVTFDEFHDHLMVFVTACRRARDTATSVAVEGRTRPRSEAREAWIANMIAICARYGLPTDARKDGLDPPSPFVSLLWELEQRTDNDASVIYARQGHDRRTSEYRRKALSRAALAKEINEVKRRFGTKRARPRKR
jgi:hypothetical protein